MRVHEEVSEALAGGRPVVALESTISSHGLPRPRNVGVARDIEAAVRSAGAVPATIALVGGEVRIGLDDAALEAIASSGDVVKCGVRDLAPAAARGAHGATTVAATSYLAVRAGIGTFASTPITVVCAGVKSILDVGATLERLETLNVTVLGYGTDAFPGFYLSDSGFPVPWRVDSPEEAAMVMRAREGLRSDAAIVVANPLPEAEQLDPALHARVLEDGLAAAGRAGDTGKDATPFLLDFFHRETGGASLEVNVRIVLRNAELAARIAAAA